MKEYGSCTRGEPNKFHLIKAMFSLIGTGLSCRSSGSDFKAKLEDSLVFPAKWYHLRRCCAKRQLDLIVVLLFDWLLGNCLCGYLIIGSTGV